MFKLIKKTYEGRKKLHQSTNITEKAWDGLYMSNLEPMFLFRKVIQEFGVAYSDSFKTHQRCYPNLYIL